MEVTLKVPATLADVKLKDYQKLQKIEEPSNLDVISCLLRVDRDVLKHVRSKDIVELDLHLKNLFNRQYNLQHTFKMNGKEWGFIPNLDDAAYEEIDNIEQCIGDWSNIHLAMATMYRPVTYKKGRKYLIEEFEGVDKYAGVMKDAPLDVVLGANVFFYRLTTDLLTAIPNYMREETIQAQSKGISPPNGEDIHHSIDLLEATLSNLKLPENYPIGLS